MKAIEIIDFLATDVLEYTGVAEMDLMAVIAFTDAIHNNYPTAITWVNDSNALKYKGSKIDVGFFIVSPESKDFITNVRGVTIVCKSPRQSFQKILSKWFGDRRSPLIEKSANIATGVKIGVDCYIGHNVVVEEGCVIGDYCEILHNTVLLKGTRVGSNVRIGSNCTIGNYGFGYEKNDSGQYKLIEHLGIVVIENDVEIHNNTCIDRAVLGSTVIEKNVKIDNLVHIAHGVRLEENSLVIAHAMVAGSVVVGRNSWISPGALVKNQLKVGADAIVGLGAVVVKNVPDGQTVIGNPAESMESFKEWSVVRKKLTEK